MTEAAHIASIAAFAFLGAFTGYGHFKLLSWNVHALIGRKHGLMSACASLGRAAFTVSAFGFAADHGAPALIAALGGFLACRAILLRCPDYVLS